MTEALTFEQYQEQAGTTAQYPGQGEFLGLAYAALGLTGEAGEASEQVKKTWRDDGARITERIYRALDYAEIDLQGNKLPGQIIADLRWEIGEAFKLKLSDERRAKIMGEIGDALWYAARLASEAGLSLQDVAQFNLDKLASRRERGLIKGEGSDR